MPRKKAPPEPEMLLTIKQTAPLLQMSEKALYQRIYRGYDLNGLRVVRMERTLRIRCNARTGLPIMNGDR